MGFTDSSGVYAKYEEIYLGRTSKSTLWGSLFFPSKMPSNASLKGLRAPLTHDEKSIVYASECHSELYACKEREILEIVFVVPTIPDIHLWPSVQTANRSQVTDHNITEMADQCTPHNYNALYINYRYAKSMEKIYVENGLQYKKHHRQPNNRNIDTIEVNNRIGFWDSAIIEW